MSGGENVRPERVEAVLREHPSVSEAAVVGAEDREWGQAVIAFVVADGSAPLDREELLAHARERLERHEVPKRIEPVEELPRTVVGEAAAPQIGGLTSDRAWRNAGTRESRLERYEEGDSITRSAIRIALIAALAAGALLGLVAPRRPSSRARTVESCSSAGGRTATLGAEIFLLPVISSFGGGTLSPPVASIVGTQHRHPTWSPDRTKIAYARGDSATGNFDIYVQDLTAPGSDPVNITQSNAITDDRPSWSPNGARIAYESEVSDGSGQTDVLIEPAGGGAVQNLTNTATAGQFEGKPVWSPDSATIYYEKGNPRATPTKTPASSGGPRRAAPRRSRSSTRPTSEFQPSISPDGTKVCFTQSPNGYVNAAATNVRIADLTTPPDATPTTVSLDAAAGDYNCTWSPDGQFIAYVNGVFGAGRS